MFDWNALRRSNPNALNASGPIAPYPLDTDSQWQTANKHIWLYSRIKPPGSVTSLQASHGWKADVYPQWEGGYKCPTPQQWFPARLGIFVPPPLGDFAWCLYGGKYGAQESFGLGPDESISQSVKRFDKRSLRQFNDYYVYFQKRKSDWY